MTLHRAGLLGDIHAEDELLGHALAFFRARGVDSVLAVGDIVDGPGDPGGAVRLLAGADARAVRGNHDRWILDGSLRNLPGAHRRESLPSEDIEYIGRLPPTLEIETATGLLLLCHGLGEDDMTRLTPDDQGYALESNGALQALLGEGRFRYVVGGHTHLRMVRTFARGVGAPLTVINAGTLFREHDPCIALADFAALTVAFFEWRGHGFVEVAAHRLG